jgi:hypothetical protein
MQPPKFYFSGSITHKLTFKTKIYKFTCIVVFFRSCEQKLHFLYGQFFFSKIHRQIKTFTKFKYILDLVYWGHNPSNKTQSKWISTSYQCSHGYQCSHCYQCCPCLLFLLSFKLSFPYFSIIISYFITFDFALFYCELLNSFTLDCLLNFPQSLFLMLLCLLLLQIPHFLLFSGQFSITSNLFSYWFPTFAPY